MGQQFVDCSTQNHGCDGGSMDLGLMYARTTAVATERSYPYNAIGGYCQQDFNPAIPQGSVTGLTDVDQSVEALKSALNHGPVSVGIEADQDFSRLHWWSHHLWMWFKCGSWSNCS